MKPAERCFALCKARNLTLSAAESCTGGRVSAALTAVSGVSAVFAGGVVSYQTPVKAKVLRVPQAILDEYGAVSEPCARAMAEGVRALMGTDLAVSVTGVAGPDRDERGNEVGLVFIACASKSGTVCRRFAFGNAPREEIQTCATDAALALVCGVIEEMK